MNPKSTSPAAWCSAATGLAFAAALGISSASAQSATNRDLDGDGIINALDPDIDNDAIPNGADRNVDGGKCKKGKFKGKYIGDRLRNDDPRELDIDDDGLPDDSAFPKMATCSFPAPRRSRTEENSSQVSRTRVPKVAGVCCQVPQKV